MVVPPFLHYLYYNESVFIKREIINVLTLVWICNVEFSSSNTSDSPWEQRYGTSAINYVNMILKILTPPPSLTILLYNLSPPIPLFACPDCFIQGESELSEEGKAKITNLYVGASNENAHQAWTSPIRLAGRTWNYR